MFTARYELNLLIRIVLVNLFSLRNTDRKYKPRNCEKEEEMNRISSCNG